MNLARRQVSVLRGALACCVTAAVLVPAMPAAAKDRWFENPVEKRRQQERRDETRNSIEREHFSAPPRAYLPMFGPEAERRLKAAIRRYAEIAARGGWPRIPKGPGLGPGSVDERVSLLRQRLLVTGDLPASVGRGYKFQPSVAEAVMRFQLRHGLKPTGRVYRTTLDAMNVPAKARLAQLRLNLDRIRRIARQLNGKRYIVVNIPAYELRAITGGKVDLYSRVITGKPATPTPVLTASIRALDFHPYWHVPRSIATRALIPIAAKKPEYLVRERIRVFAGAPPGGELDPARVDWSKARTRGYLFRQDPGPLNALGYIRLDMPNSHTVYMHDTPLQRLFRYSVRSYSAGCVRVHGILPLAEWLLNGNGGWSRARIEQMIAADKSETVPLARPVPVHLVYVTAWGGPDGAVQFRPDIYNRDGAGRFVAELEGPKEQISAVTP